VKKGRGLAWRVADCVEGCPVWRVAHNPTSLRRFSGFKPPKAAERETYFGKIG